MNLFSRQSDRQIGRIGRQLPARGLGCRCNFLLGRGDNLACVLFRRGLDASFFGRAFFLGRVAHHANFNVEFHQARLDLRQPAARFFAGHLRFLHCLLDGGAAVAENSRQILASRPDDDARDHHESSETYRASKTAADSIPSGVLTACTEADCLNSANSSFSVSGGFLALVRQLAARATGLLRGVRWPASARRQRTTPALAALLRSRPSPSAAPAQLSE